MDVRHGGQRYCPTCKKIVETRVLLEGYSQTPIHGIRRQVICGTDGKGTGECGTKWFTAEILEEKLGRSSSGGKRNFPSG